MAGSPVLGVLSVSLTSTRSSDPSHLIGLAGLTSLCLNRMDLPCSRCFLWLHAGGTNPGSTASHLQCCATCDSAFPIAGQGRLLRSRSISGLFSRSLHSGLQPPCLRFATAVTGRHARLGSRLLARLCRGRHRRRQTSTRLQGATRTDPYGPNSGIRLPPWVSNGEATRWPRMKDSRFREPVVGQPLDPLPGRPVFLAPLP